MERELVQISVTSKRDVMDILAKGIFNNSFYYFGRLTEINFLNRIFTLDELPSEDSRFENMRGDIWQHTVNNNDLDPDWVFSDERLNLKNNNDKFIDFLEQVFHPIVIDEDSNWKEYLNKINKILLYDKVSLSAVEEFDGRPLYKLISIRNLNLIVNYSEGIKLKFNTEYIDSQVSLMLNNIESNPNTAIGKSKELLESCVKSILEELEFDYDSNMEFPKLLRLTMKKLGLSASDQDKSTKEGEISAKLLGNLGAVPQNMAELRNEFGDGHGKSKSFISLPPRYARLAVGTSVTMVYFLWETYQDRKTNF